MLFHSKGGRLLHRYNGLADFSYERQYERWYLPRTAPWGVINNLARQRVNSPSLKSTLSHQPFVLKFHFISISFPVCIASPWSALPLPIAIKKIRSKCTREQELTQRGKFRVIDAGDKDVLVETLSPGRLDVDGFGLLPRRLGENEGVESDLLCHPIRQHCLSCAKINK